MKIKITNPSDAFNMLEVVDFRFTGIPRQNSKKQLFIKAIKFKFNEDDSCSYSDDPPVEVFIKDLDLYLEQDLISGNNLRYNTFINTVDSVGSIFKDKFGIEYELI